MQMNGQSRIVAQSYAKALSIHADNYPDQQQISVSAADLNYLIKVNGNAHDIFVLTVDEGQDVETLWCHVDIATKAVTI